MWSRNKINSVLATIILFLLQASARHLHYANDAKTFLKHFSDCLFYFCSTCADCLTVVTHADGSRVSIAIIRVCDYVILSVCLSVCPHDKTKTAETKIVKLETGIVRHDTLPIY